MVYFYTLIFFKRTGLQTWTKLNGPYLYTCPKSTTTEKKWTKLDGPFFYTSIFEENWIINMDLTYWSIFAHLSEMNHK